VLGQYFLGVQEPGILFDIILHLGTLLAVIFYYRADVYNLTADSLKALKRFAETRSVDAALELPNARIALFIVLATIPTGIMGVLIGKLLDPDVGPSLVTPTVVFGLLILNGTILFSNRFVRDVPNQPEPTWNLTWKKAILLGMSQGFAVLPGISRSGTTITTALALGVSRPEAARFSFLLSIPAILGAVVLKFDTSVFSGDEGMTAVMIYTLGATAAGVVGYLCLKLLVALLKAARFYHFAWYSWAVGVTGLVYMWFFASGG
jgi:undecaprenyl-diphosphatase